MWKATCFLILVLAVSLSVQKKDKSDTSSSSSSAEVNGPCKICRLKEKYFKNTNYSLETSFPKDNEHALIKICNRFARDPDHYRCDEDCRCQEGQPCILPCKQLPRFGYCKGARGVVKKCTTVSEQFAAWVSGMCTMTDFPVCANDLCLCNHHCGLCRSLGYQSSACPPAPLTTTTMK